MAWRCRELQLICSIGQPHKNKTRSTKKGARIEIASFSGWLANRKTLRTKKGARIEIASFAEWLANKKRCAQRNSARTEDAAHKERRANRTRCAQRKARKSNTLLTKKGVVVMQTTARAFQNGSVYAAHKERRRPYAKKNEKIENIEMIKI